MSGLSATKENEAKCSLTYVFSGVLQKKSEREIIAVLSRLY